MLASSRAPLLPSARLVLRTPGAQPRAPGIVHLLEGCVAGRRDASGTAPPCAAGAASFSVSQAGYLRNGDTVTVAATPYVVSAFNGTNACTLR
jgi:hypothetical protein